MNYFNEVYSSRINHLGNSTAERIRNGGIRSFYKWMAQSPHTVKDLSVERGIYFSGIILTSKDKEYQKIMFLNVANDVQIKVGDIMNWTLDDGSIEKWILFQEEKKVNGTYKTFWMVRCNYLLKWIDVEGHLQQCWAYLVSSVDSKIKGNYRTWNSLITPQPNKYLEILMPRYPIDRATNFIVEEESWAVIEYDHTSVPGIIYLSLTEGKINLIYDDLNNNVADTDRLANYYFALPQKAETFNIGDEIKPAFTLMKDGQVCQLEIELMPMNVTYVNFVNGVLTAIAAGETTVLARSKKYPEVKTEIPIVITDVAEFSAYIEGPDKVHLDRQVEYKLIGTQNIETETVNFSIDNIDFVSIVKSEYNSCIIKTNNKNKLGSVVLTAAYGGKTYTKTIMVIPVWQVI